MKKSIFFPTPVAVLLVLLSGATASAASTIVVPRDFATIQAAVDAAAPGSTIDVGSGIYIEEVVIEKDLNLRGTGVTETFVISPATLTPYAVDTRNGNQFYAIVRVAHGAHVRISGLTVSGPTPCGFVFGIVAVQDAVLDVSDACVVDMVPDPDACDDPSHGAGRGVQFGLPDAILIDGVRGTSASGRVTGVLVDTFLDQGLAACGPRNGPPSRVVFSNNLVITGDPLYETEQIGIHVFLAAEARITGNTVSGGVCTLPDCGPDPVNEYQAIGILVDSGAAATIADNDVSDSDIGIYQYFSPNGCRISDNRVSGNRYYGIVIQNGDGETRGNTITGGEIGIVVVADFLDTVAVLHDDDISETSVAPVREIECFGFVAIAIIKHD